MAALFIGALLVRLARRRGAWTWGAVGASVAKVVVVVAYLALATRADFGAYWVKVAVAPLVAFAVGIGVFRLVAGSIPRRVISVFWYTSAECSCGTGPTTGSNADSRSECR